MVESDVQENIFKEIETVLVIDWPSQEIPELLTLAGLEVVVRGGTGPDDFSAYELDNGLVIAHHTGKAPERADLIYSYRPLSELPELVATAKNLNAKAIWTQSGLKGPGVKDPKGCWLSDEELQMARNLVVAAGLKYVTEPYIGDAVREMKKINV